METIDIYPLKEKASRICLGTWSIGGWMWGGTDEQEAIKTIHHALDLGINCLDTAPVYGFGASERIVGKALAAYGKREKIILATKCGLAWDADEKITRDSSPEHLRKELDQSLQRLKTDYIDIYQIHWPDLETPFEQTAQVLQEFYQQGKIRAIGVSNFSSKQMREFMKFSPIHTSQPPYNLFEREIEKDVLPFTEKHKIVSLCYGAICRGLLAGKMNTHTQFKGDDLRKYDPKFQSPRFASYLQAVFELDRYAQVNFDKTVLALAVRFILDRGRTIALWGARHKDQLNSIQEIMGWHLDEQSMCDIEKIVERNVTNPVGPEFMAPPEHSMT